MANPTCLPATEVTSTSGVINGSADNIPPTQFIRVAWSLVAGGPYSPGVNDPGTNTLDQQTNLAVSPLTPGQTVFYVLQEIDADGTTVLATSSECSFTTSAAPAAGFVPMPCANCGGGSGGVTPPEFDAEQLLLCDVGPDGEILGTALMVTTYDESTGLPTGPPLPVDPATGDPYVVQGTLRPCSESGHTHTEILCDIQADNSAVTFKRIEVLGPLNTVVDTIDVTLDGAPYAPLGTVALCDPYANCTPDANQDLNAACGPGESPVQAVVAASPDKPLSNSIYNDDPTADPLCGGQWDRPADDLPPGFPVAESFRNTTFDQPGPVLQGNPADLPFLTAGPPTNDGSGAGWLRLADTRGGSNGVWQVPTPFATVDGMNAAISYASHDGTTPGGDGMAFVFTNGGIPAQAAPIGGFGNLGLQNWQGGYIAVVLDEYGQTCTCDQTPGGSPNPGPCGFCSNSISIQLAGAARIGATCACCTLASAPLTPKALNLTTRSSPARLLTSIISEGGQVYVSASVDWNDGNGPVQYFDRVNVTACAGPPPATLRMAAYGGSGGAFQAVKEARDAVARPAGVSNWRAFPITTDPVPACVTLLNVSATVDVTFTDDGTQVAGNNNPEAYFYLVNTATNTIVASDRVSALPAQIGTPQTLDIAATVPPADLPNLRLYVGAESRDENGEYSSTWENLDVQINGTGCPATPRRTLEISARCPIPVAIVSGGSSGGGGGTTIVNTPSTFEDEPVCGTVGGVATTLFRHEVRSPDGAVEVTFLGTNGLPATPDGGWAPGPCPCNGTVLGDVCIVSGDFPGVILPAVAMQACDGTVTYLNRATGDPWPNFVSVVVCPPANELTEEVLCDQGNAGVPFRRVYTMTPLGSAVDFDEDLDGNPYIVVGPVVSCSTPTAVVLGQICYAAGPPQVFSGTLGAPTTNAVGLQTYQNFQGSGVDITITSTSRNGVQINPPGNDPVNVHFSQPVNLISITAGELDNTNQERWFGFTPPFTGGTGSIVLNSPFAGAVSSSIANGNPDGDILFGSPTVTDLDFTAQSTPGGLGSWLLALAFSQPDDSLSRRAVVVKCDGCTDQTVQYFDVETGAEVLAPSVITCPGDTAGPTAAEIGAAVAAAVQTRDSETEILCDANGTTFLRKYVYDGEDATFVGILNTTLDGTTPFAPVGAVGVCPITANITTALFDVEVLVLCDATPTRFLRRYVYDSETPGVITVVNTTLDGVTPFVPVGAVGVCSVAVQTDFDFLSTVLCDANGTQFIQRLTFNSSTGAVTATTNTTLTGGAFVPVGAVSLCANCCPVVIGSGCVSTGSGRYTALRLPTGVITLIDSVTGAAVLAANIIACADDNLVKTLTAQHRLVGDADAPWTPGADVVGTLTSVTYTVLSGTATVIDQNGTVAAGLPPGLAVTWSALDDNTLSGPTSVDAIGGNVYVHWTQR